MLDSLRDELDGLPVLNGKLHAATAIIGAEYRTMVVDSHPSTETSLVVID